jgi:hypothetical protein
MSNNPENTAQLYDDLNTILQQMSPQALALARHERSAPMFRRGAAGLVTSPALAVQVLGPKGAKALARALITVGQRHIANGERMQELASEAEAAAERTDP